MERKHFEDSEKPPMETPHSVIDDLDEEQDEFPSQRDIFEGTRYLILGVDAAVHLF